MPASSCTCIQRCPFSCCERLNNTQEAGTSCCGCKPACRSLSQYRSAGSLAPSATLIATFQWHDSQPGCCRLQLCGLTFKEGLASSVMPVAPMDALLIPDPYTMQVVHRPHLHAPRQPVTAFGVLTLIPPQVGCPHLLGPH